MSVSSPTCSYSWALSAAASRLAFSVVRRSSRLSYDSGCAPLWSSPDPPKVTGPRNPLGLLSRAEEALALGVMVE
eukprot:2388102-Pyramimonas_sp.AAC.2